MKNSIFSHAVVNTEINELKIIYALLLKTNALDFFTVKTKEFFDKDQHYLYQHLQKEVGKLGNIKIEELQIELLIELAQISDSPLLSLNSIAQIEEQGSLIIQNTFKQLLKSNKEFQRYVKDFENLSEYELIIHFQMQLLFSAFDEKYLQLSEKDALNFSYNIAQIIIALPEKQQISILNALKIEQISDQAIHQLIQDYSTTPVLTILIEAAGLSTSQSIISAISSSYNILGIPLPFGIQSFTQTLFSVILNPNYLRTIGFQNQLLITKHLKTFQKQLLPLVILQILLPKVTDQQLVEANFTPIINSWQQIYRRYESYKIEELYLEELIDEHRSQIKAMNNTILGYQQQLELLKSEIIHLRKEVKRYIYAIPLDEQSIHLKVLLQDIHYLEDQKQHYNELNEQEALKGTIWDTITATVDKSKNTAMLKRLQKEIELKEKNILDEIINSKPPTLHYIVSKLQAADFENKRIQQTLVIKKELLSNEKNALQFKEKELYSIKQLTKQFLQDYHGLELTEQP